MQCVREQRTLLILDGLEPLQNPSTSPHAGQIRDLGLAALVRELAIQNTGLCVISTRARVQDIEWLEGTAAKFGPVKTVNLESLAQPDGAALLRQLGVHGTREQLENATEEVRGHALALSLLGNYLREALRGDIDGRHDIGLLDKSLDGDQGGHAKRMMERLEMWLAGQIKVKNESAKIKESGYISLEILRLTGLFDRPITIGEFAAIIKGDAGGSGPIPGLTDALAAASIPTLNQAIGNLESVNLVQRLTDDPITLDVKPYPVTAGRKPFLDAHPLIREHFTEVLTKRFPIEAREAHRRLYEHLKRSSPYLPDKMSDMILLYHAVAHGCRAGLLDDAFVTTYLSRIHGREQRFLDRQEIVSAEIALLSEFFDRRWDCPSKSLSSENCARLLHRTTSALFASGQVEKCEKPLKHLTEYHQKLSDYKETAATYDRLSIVYQLLGKISDALHCSKESIRYADMSDELIMRVKTRTTLGTAWHFAGVRSKALATFIKAEELQHEMRPQYPLLYSMDGYQYCDLLLEEICRGSQPWHSTEVESPLEADRMNSRSLQSHGTQAAAESPQQAIAHIHEVRNRAEEMFREHLTLGLLSNAFHHLALGRTWLLEGMVKNLGRSVRDEVLSPLTPLPSHFGEAKHHFDQCVILMRQADTQHELPRGLLHRAALWRMELELTVQRAGKSHQPKRPTGEADGDGKRELQQFADRDLTEAESIAVRGSMLIWQIEAALERTRLALIMHQAGCKTEARAEPESYDARISGPAGETPSPWIVLAREKLDEAKRLIKQTECTYEPHVPDWKDFELLEYEGVLKEREIVGYHCRNDEIAALQIAINQEK